MPSTPKLPKPPKPASRAKALAARITLVAYGTFIGFVVFWPVPVDSQGPTHQVVEAVVHYTQSQPALIWADYNFFEAASNIALFAPLGALLVLNFKKLTWWQATLIGTALSTSAELIQLTVLTARVFSPLDILHNTLGALIGAGIGKLLSSIGSSKNL